MYDNGNIGEDFYDENEFPLDSDKDGKTYILNSVKDHLCRSKIMYHPKILADKKELINNKIAAIDNEKVKNKRGRRYHS